MNKSILRRKVLQVLATLPLHQRVSANVQIEKNLIELLEFKKAKTILFYASFASEVSTYSLLRRFWHLHNKQRLILPRVMNDNLILQQVENFENLKMSNWGILEPLPNCLKILPKEIDLAIVPGVAFDKKGNRLGRGKGFYDRLLPEISASKIGLAFSCQIVKSLPTQAHDVKVDKVVTEEGVEIMNNE